MKQSRSFHKIYLWATSILIASFLHTPTWAQESHGEASPETPADQPRLVVQLGHSGKVMGARLSPDGRFLMTGSTDGTALLWEVATGREVRRFEGHSGWASQISFPPDGQFVLTTDRGETVRLWDIKTGTVMLKLAKPKTMVVAVSPGGRFVVTGDWDGTAVLWEVATGREVRRFTEHTGQVSHVAFSPDGQFVLTTHQSGIVRLWGMRSDQVVQHFAGHTKSVYAITFSSDGRFLLTGSEDGTARVWEVATGREVQRLEGHTGNVSDVVFAPDTRMVVTLSDTNRTVRFWDITTGQEIRRLQKDALNVAASFNVVDLSPDGRFLLMTVTTNKVSDPDRVVYLVETTTGQEVRRFEPFSSGDPFPIVSPDGRWLLMSGMHGITPLWDITTGQIVRHFNRPMSTAVFSPDGSLLVTIEYENPTRWKLDNIARLWEVATGREVRHFTGHTAEVRCVAFSPDGQFVATGSEDQTARVWEVATGKEIQRVTKSYTVSSLMFSPDGRFLLTASLGSGLDLWDVATGQLAWTHYVEPGGGAPSFVAFSPDGQSLLMKKGSEAFLLEITGGAVHRFGQLQRFDQPSVPSVLSTALSPDGQFVLTGNSDNTARLWDVATVKESGRYVGATGYVGSTAKEIRRFEGHRGSVWSTAFSPDGRFVLTGSSDNTARLWDVATGRELCRLISFRDGTWVVVDPEGRFDTNNLDNNPGLHWIMPDDPLTPLPLEIFMRDYYEPRLLPRILAGEKFRPVRALQDLNRVQPPVQITTIEPHPTVPDSVSVTVEVAKAAREFQRGNKKVFVETGVYDLRLFREGQLVGYAPTADGEIPVDPQTGTATRTFTVTLPQVAGKKEVAFSAYAFNVDRVKSATDRKVFPLPPISSPVKGRAYLISVGVNAYENPAWDLRFAGNDARQIQRVLHAQLAHTGQYTDVISIPLISDAELRNGERVMSENHATKQNIHTVLQLLAGKPADQEHVLAIPQVQQLQPAHPEDLVLISFSSHGYADPNGIFYFFPFDIGAGQGQQITETLLQHSISSDELSQWLRDIDSGEMVLIVDACHSAATVEGEGFKPGPMGSRGLGQLAYDKGMRILTASQADDVALESDLLQQGLLTHALIHEGLEARRADFQPQDQTITLIEWLGYGVERVPTLYEEVKKGQVQTFKPEQQGRGVVIISTSPDSSLKKKEFQQPALFDFARHRRPVVLVQGQ